jgi:hypothetical protein
MHGDLPPPPLLSAIPSLLQSQVRNDNHNDDIDLICVHQIRVHCMQASFLLVEQTEFIVEQSVVYHHTHTWHTHYVFLWDFISLLSSKIHSIAEYDGGVRS